MKKQKNVSGRWLEAENGHECSSDSTFIIQTLKEIKKSHKFVILLHKGYQSGNTVIASVDNKNLSIGCPADWPGTAKKIRVLFRDAGRVWNYFTAPIISKSKDTLKISFPTELFRMQRRAYYRVQMSSECKASFVCHGDQFENLTVNDLSVGGMLFCLPHVGSGVSFNDAESLTQIVITVPDGENDDDGFLNIAVSQGFVARSFELENGAKCLGIKFNLQGTEEKELLKFVRQNELASLRKGV
jgi:c-di-GMP-binding flagellar brake protein YcgR